MHTARAGAMDYLRAFPSTAPLVRMILVITRDVGPFLGVCSIVIVGCTCFFAINQPEAGSAFGDFDGVAGFLSPLLTVTLAALGSFSIGDYTKRAAVGMFLFFAFFVIVLMLNLLIAIMGDAYSKVKENELVEGLHERAKMIVDSRARVATTNTLSFAVSSLALGIRRSDRSLVHGW
jgi:hypothetical protein